MATHENQNPNQLHLLTQCFRVVSSRDNNFTAPLVISGGSRRALCQQNSADWHNSASALQIRLSATFKFTRRTN
jgi:hypothetical protein